MPPSDKNETGIIRDPLLSLLHRYAEVMVLLIILKLELSNQWESAEQMTEAYRWSGRALEKLN